MPLQIRRGTEAQRQVLNVPLVDGELLWISDDQKLYIGNGSTLARDLLPVTGYGDTEAKDAAASVFTSGTHSGISFVYDGTTSIDATVSYPALLENLDLNNFNITGTGNLNVTGTVTATSFVGDFQGTISADDSTILLDAIDASLNLDGTIKGNVIPDVDNIRDIGSSSKKFRSLWVRDDGLNVGLANISSTGTSINLPAGSTVGGVPIGTVELVGGTNLNVNIIADDSSLMVDTSTGTIFAPNGFVGDLTGRTTGVHIGEVIGSVFGDDSGLLIDGIDGKAYLTALETTAINVPGGGLIIDSINQTRIQSSNKSGLRSSAVVEDGTIGNAPQFDLHVCRGSQASPETPNVGDYLGALRWTYYEGVTDIGNSIATLTAQIDPAADLTDDLPAGNLTLLLNAGDGLGFSGFGVQVFNFKKEGTFEAPMLKPGVYANPTARDAYITSPEEGMMVYVTDSTGSGGLPKFQGYVSDTGGGSPGWVDLH